MSSKVSKTPLYSRPLSSNGDSTSEDDVFENSRLHVLSRGADLRLDNLRQQDDGDPIPVPESFLDYEMDRSVSVTSMFSPSPKSEDNAVIFSVHFCGKYFGEVGLFEPDISILDWVGFKHYIFSSLNLEASDAYAISYSHNGIDKVVIECEEDYEEALHYAKLKATSEKKLGLFIGRVGGAFPTSLRSLVSTRLKRVNSTSGTKTNATQHLKKDVTTSTNASLHNIDKLTFHRSVDLRSDTVSSPFVPVPYPTELGSPQENYFEDPPHLFHKDYYEEMQLEDADPISNSFHFVPHKSASWDATPGHRQDEGAEGIPAWFASYMRQFKEELSLEVSSKIDERFNDAVGNLSATDVEAKLRGLLTGYSQDLQNKVLCCCTASNEPCQKAGHEDDLRLLSQPGTPMKCDRSRFVPPMTLLKLDHRDDSMDLEGHDNQDYFLQKLLKREQEILDFLDCTNEKIKEKIKVNNDYTDSLRSCLTKELAIEERERVLARIEDFRQRKSRTTNDIKMLQQSMEVNNEGMLRLTLQDALPTKDFDAKFIRDESFADGSRVAPNQFFQKHWGVQNTGCNPWNEQTFLVCQSYLHMRPFQEKISCPPLRPGEIGRISAQFRAPCSPGIYSTEWRFIQGDTLFGNHLWCTVIVPSEADLHLSSKTRDPDYKSSSLGNAMEDLRNDCNSFKYGYRSNRESMTQPPEELERLRRHSASETPVYDRFPKFYQFEEGSEEAVNMKMKNDLVKMSSKQVLRHLMYAIRVAKPDFNSIRESDDYKCLFNCLTRGAKCDWVNLFLTMDDTFLTQCSKKNFTIDDMIMSYDDLFITGDSMCQEDMDLIAKGLSIKYMRKSFNAGQLDKMNFCPDNSKTNISDTQIESGVDVVSKLEAHLNAFNDMGAKERNVQCGAGLESPDDSRNAQSELVSGTDIDDREYDDDDDEWEDDGEYYEDEGHKDHEDQKKTPDEEQKHFDHLVMNTKCENHDEKAVKTENGDPNFKARHGNDPSMIHEESKESEADVDDDNSESSESDDEESRITTAGTESQLEDPENNELASEIELTENESEVDENVDLVFCRVTGRDCADENDGYSSCSDYTADSDSTQHSNPADDQKQENDLKNEEISLGSFCKSRKVEADDAAASSSSPRDRLTPTNIKKDISSLHENFNQNVQVQLDFEIISRTPTKEEDVVKAKRGCSDALTFQEKHFTFSSRPPPAPVHVPDSDDESFDGLVFLETVDGASSKPRNAEHSELNSSLSVSCSSFSEVDDDVDDDDDDDRHGDGDVSGKPSNGVHKRDSIEACSESSSSVVVDQLTSVYYETCLPDVVNADSIMAELRLAESDSSEPESVPATLAAADEANDVKSPERNVDSGSSTSHTLRDLVTSESSEAYDTNDAPPTELALEESTSEFEYISDAS